MTQATSGRNTWARRGSPGPRRRLGVVAAGLVTVILASCGGAAEKASSSGVTATSAVTQAPVQGKFDVGGHSLYLSCRGSGSPTVVYLHGAIDNTAAVPHQNGVAFQELLVDRQRVCVYDRRNVGESDAVEGPQLPETPSRTCASCSQPVT